VQLHRGQRDRRLRRRQSDENRCVTDSLATTIPPIVARGVLIDVAGRNSPGVATWARGDVGGNRPAAIRQVMAAARVLPFARVGAASDRPLGDSGCMYFLIDAPGM